MKKLLFFLALMLLMAAPAEAQFTLSGEFRPRLEYRSGYRNILADSQSDAFFVSQRTRMELFYEHPKISVGFSLQDVRVWGDAQLATSSGVFGDNASIDLHEAWVNLLLYPGGTLKIGRQLWAIEDERILSNRNWNQSQVKYDGIRFQHKREGFQILAGLSWNNRAENIYGNDYPSDRMKTMNFLHLKKDLTGLASVSGTVFLSGFTQTDTTSAIHLLSTFAGYLNINKGPVKAVLSGFYQNGRSREGKEAGAYMFSVKGDYVAGKVTIGAGIDYLSGNNGARQDSSYQDREHSFDILYGMRHGYYGHMDFFSSMQKSTGSGGLVDIFMKFKWKFVPQATLSIDLHYFSLQNNVRETGFAGTDARYLDKALGPEADLNISWDILDFLNLKGGYSVMIPSHSMLNIQGQEADHSKLPQWAWLMLTAKPVFLHKSGN